MQELSRREREKLSRRNEILQAARKVFASKDYAAATVDDVAAAAELSKGTIYLYFQNKADLFLSTFEMGMEQVASTVIESISANKNDPIVGIKDIVERILLFCEEHIDLFKIVASENAHFELQSEIGRNNSFHQRIMDKESRIIMTLTAYIQQGIDMGVFKKVDARDAASALLSIIKGFAFDWIMNLEKGSPRDKADIINTIFLDGLRQKDHIVDQH